MTPPPPALPQPAPVNATLTRSRSSIRRRKLTPTPSPAPLATWYALSSFELLLLLIQVPQHYGPTPDDSGITTRLPSICVDYLSHDWAEEDTWASWKAMTRHKTEIANGKQSIQAEHVGRRMNVRRAMVGGRE